MSARHWIGTDFTVWPAMRPLPEGLTWMLYQTEKAASTGRLHTQFIIAANRKSRITTIRGLLDSTTAHLEIARDVAASLKYCSKLETREAGPWAVGPVPTMSGKKTGPSVTNHPINMLKRMRVVDYLQFNPGHWRSVRALQQIRTSLQPKRSWPTQGVLLTGETGKGKSRICTTIAQYLHGADVNFVDALPWFDGIDAESLIVFEEFRGQLNPSTLLRLFDRSPLTVAIKGGTVQFLASWVIMTSNLTLDEMYPTLDKKTIDALKRRIKTLIVY